MSETTSNTQLETFDLAIIGGLGEGAKLRKNRMIEVTAKGIRFLGEMNLEQFTELLRGWQMVREAWDVGLADIRNYGIAQFGAEVVESLFVQMGFDFADQMRAARLGQLTLDMRLSSSLTNAHFYVLTAIEDTKERGRWMAIAEKEELTPHELQKSVAAGKVMREDEIKRNQGSNSGVTTIQGIAFWFDGWERKIGGEQIIFSWPTEQKRALLTELEKPGELYLKLKQDLAGEGA